MSSYIAPHLTTLKENDFVGRKIKACEKYSLPFLTGDIIKRVVMGSESCLTKRKEVFIMDHDFPQGGVQEVDCHSINFLVEVDDSEILNDYQI